MIPASDIEKLDALANKMDNLFRLPGTNIRFGLDGLLGLIPGVGDAAALLPAGYIIWQGRKMGASKLVQSRMVWNTGVDALLGSIPLIGDIFDIARKSNRRNVDLLRAHLIEKGAAVSSTPLPSDQTSAA